MLLRMADRLHGLRFGTLPVLLVAFIVSSVFWMGGMWVVKPERGPHAFRSIHRNLLTGEPYAGEPPVRFGGRGVSNQWDVPTPYRWGLRCPNYEHHDRPPVR